MVKMTCNFKPSIRCAFILHVLSTCSCPDGFSCVSFLVLHLYKSVFACLCQVVCCFGSGLVSRDDVSYVVCHSVLTLLRLSVVLSWCLQVVLMSFDVSGLLSLFSCLMVFCYVTFLLLLFNMVLPVLYTGWWHRVDASETLLPSHP